MNKRDFIRKVKRHLKENGFKLVFYDSEYIYNSGLRCSGLFFYDKMELSVARLHPLWFETMVHEYGHFLQYTENCKIWRDYWQHGGKWWKYVLGDSKKK